MQLLEAIQSLTNIVALFLGDISFVAKRSADLVVTMFSCNYSLHSTAALLEDCSFIYLLSRTKFTR
jgi:hypothetical protein